MPHEHMTDVAASDFAARYGRWALVVGASDGLGAAFARALAERGLDVLLVARRQAMLDDVASEIRAETGVDAGTVAVDLTTDDAVPSIEAATSGLDVGLVVYCAGADPNYEPFLSQPVANALAMVERNCVAPMRICHHFAAPMQTRGRGGIVLVSSGAGLVGGRNMVAYGASKAFDMVMAEALWAELHDRGVDVLGLVLGVTDTPALRRMLLGRGQIDDLEAPIPGAATPESVVAEALANLANGPTCFGTDDVREGANHLGAMSRNDAARMMLQMAGGVMGPDTDAAT
jgi:short-subunit dehydrogenase